MNDVVTFFVNAPSQSRPEMVDVNGKQYLGYLPTGAFKKSDPGGMIDEARAKGGIVIAIDGRTLFVDQFSKEPAKRAFKLTLFGTTEVKPLNQPITLDATERLILPVDRQAEQALESFLTALDHGFTGDARSAVYTALRRPSIDYRLDRLERDINHARPSGSTGFQRSPSKLLEWVNRHWLTLTISAISLVAVGLVLFLIRDSLRGFIPGMSEMDPPRGRNEQAESGRSTDPSTDPLRRDLATLIQSIKGTDRPYYQSLAADFGVTTGLDGHRPEERFAVLLLSLAGAPSDLNQTFRHTPDEDIRKNALDAAKQGSLLRRVLTSTVCEARLTGSENGLVVEAANELRASDCRPISDFDRASIVRDMQDKLRAASHRSKDSDK